MPKKKEKPLVTFRYDEEETDEGFEFSPVYEESTELNQVLLQVQNLKQEIDNYGEWKEVVGYLQGKNLTPKLVRKYIEAILEIEKLVD